jgi:hypothetical protein
MLRWVVILFAAAFAVGLLFMIAPSIATTAFTVAGYHVTWGVLSFLGFAYLFHRVTA